MNILFLADPQMNHTQWMLYDGLRKLPEIGVDNIVVYPEIKHFYGEVDDWYYLDDGKKGWTGPASYVSPSSKPTKQWHMDDIVTNIIEDKFAVIIFFNRTYSLKALEELLMFHVKLPPLVFVEGEDYLEIRTDIVEKYKPIRYFKRELLPQNMNGIMRPFPFCAITDYIPEEPKEKDIDVFALFGNTAPIRKQIVNLLLTSDLSSKYNIHAGIDTNPFNLPYEDFSRYNVKPLVPYLMYLDLMNRAKINIVARGWGYDSLRRFEAYCFSGLVLSDRLPIITPNPFINNIHTIYYNNDLSDLLYHVEKYLNEYENRLNMGNKGKERCYKQHTTVARATYLLKDIGLL